MSEMNYFLKIWVNRKRHINEIISDSIVRNQWIRINNCEPNKNDVDKLFNKFNEIQIESSKI